MRKIRILLLAWLLVLGATASAVASVHTCCPLKDCSIAQCVEMGCAPVMPNVAFGNTFVLPVTPPDRNYAAYVPVVPPDRYVEVWTPPD
ncbi:MULTISPECIES: hypothetical protein [unclassified Duganella]|uniref:hypothetical protein n=1 Tax=unclassified Duganella TaxID=2636909 RepID=UPI0010289F0F|nr:MULTISPECIES: hypothetical protein [unclassified Duganella]